MTTNFKTETQNPRELEAFLQFIEDHKITLYCEIGLYAGTTFKAVYDTLLRVHKGDTTAFQMIGIDLPTNPDAFAACSRVIEDIPNKSIYWTSSTDKDTVEAVLDEVRYHNTVGSDGEHLPERIPSSLLFIDGDHSYEQTKDDYAAYSYEFEYVAFNDVSPGTVPQNKLKHGGRNIATAYHVYDAIKIYSLNRWEVAMFDYPSPEGKYRGIGILA